MAVSCDNWANRFTAALLIDTQYVAIIDDDIVLGPRYLSYCLKLLHTQVRWVFESDMEQSYR